MHKHHTHRPFINRRSLRIFPDVKRVSDILPLNEKCLGHFGKQCSSFVPPLGDAINFKCDCLTSRLLPSPLLRPHEHNVRRACTRRVLLVILVAVTEGCFRSWPRRACRRRSSLPATRTQRKYQLLHPAPPYYPFPRRKVHTMGNIWGFTVG